MKNTFGTSVLVTLFGESHGSQIGAIIDGLAPGITVNEEYIAKKLSLRRPAGRISTGRIESDRFRIVSGVFEGRTTGTPICILIPNENVNSRNYEDRRFLARPGHADYTAWVKYHGCEDYRGGGHFSGRLTAALTAAGAIAMSALEARGIRIGTHIARCAGLSDRGFDDIRADLEILEQRTFAVLDEDAGERMRAAIEAAADDGDSVGGVLETIVTGMPAGVGEPWFDTLEGVLSHALFSIPAVKGVEFGEGFAMADMRGSRSNDSFRMDGGTVVTATNHNGGINGGISNGMPLVFRCAVKPTSSIYREQETVHFRDGRDASLKLTGRHDPAIVHRARVVADAVTALTLCDLLAQRYGTDWLASGDSAKTSAGVRQAGRDDAQGMETPAAPEKPERNIVLIGMSRAGKTTVGKLLSERLHRKFVDTDLEIIAREKRPITEIFAEGGEKYFRDLETEIARSLMNQHGLVIATGGGIVLREENMDALREGSIVIFLDRSIELIAPADDRPLANTSDKVYSLYKYRYPIYRSICDLQVENDLSPEHVVDKILKILDLLDEYPAPKEAGGSSSASAEAKS